MQRRVFVSHPVNHPRNHPRHVHPSRLLFTLLIVTLTALVALLNLPPRLTEAQGRIERGLYLKSHRVQVTIENQLAVTRIEQVFVNAGSGLAEGTYLFPLPPGAAVSDLKLTINGVTYQANLLSADEAQRIYTEIVRSKRDPVLLQYVGRGAIQANIFPIPAGEERKIEIVYSSIAPAENSLISYTYPLRTDYVTSLPVEQVSVSVEVKSDAPIGTVYSPNPLVGISRSGDNGFRAGFETNNYRAAEDFTIYYSTTGAPISANLLTYRGSADEDGFFMLMITPPTDANAERVIPKDVIIVLDQSGSMAGPKWDQARAAAAYVLNNLNPQDRFNAVVFSTGYRIYARTLQPVSEARAAAEWINGLEATGGTGIDDALKAALKSADSERPTVILFLTDGLPTEGVTDARGILDNVRASANANTRIFAFGVGNDVDTFLLDSLSSGYGGTSVYVRPGEDIKQKVSGLYDKINSPVLTALELNVDGAVMLEDSYPTAPLPDLFAGQQLIVVGRYRGQGTATITLTGKMNGEMQTFSYPALAFPANAGGQSFIPRLWATRKVGALLNTIRLNGETPELVDSVMRLSTRYGIITPYTSFLITEDDINPAPREGRGGIVPPPPPGTAVPLGQVSQAPASGAAAVDKAQEANDMAGAAQPAALPTALAMSTATGGENFNAPSAIEIRTVLDRTFRLVNGVWIDTAYVADQMKLTPITFLSDAYFALLTEHPTIKDYLALGQHVILVIGDQAYEIKP